MHSIRHTDTVTITSETPLFDTHQLESAAGLNYSVIVDGTEYRSASPMHIVADSDGIYSDAYLFDVASRLLDAGQTSVDAVEYITTLCHVDSDRAGRIVSQAFDPS